VCLSLLLVNRWTTVNVIFVTVIGGDLFSYIDEHGPVKEAQAMYILQELLRALTHLHEHGIFHLDISPENVFIGTNNQFALGDFGMATRNTKFNNHRLPIFPGKTQYAAPEVQTKSVFQSAAADVFSLGMTLVAMLSRSLPYRHRHTSNFHRFVGGTAQTWQDYFINLHISVSPGVCQLLSIMISPVSERASLEQVNNTVLHYPVIPLEVQATTNHQ
jgi:carbon catabolite-derepressing protein kinase